MRLFPRLPSTVARDLAVTYATMSLRELEERASYEHELAFFAPVGGGRADDHFLRQLQESIYSIARSSGYPDRPSRDQARRFDVEIAIRLHEDMEVTPHEAAQDGVWQFVCCVLVPSVVRWRFPGGASGTSTKRFFGGVRNAIGRLWWRATILSDGSHADRYRIVRGLREDEAVQIMERPTLAGYRPVARAVARQFLDAVEGRRRGARIGEASRMFLMRETQKRMMRVLPVLAVDLMDDAGVETLARVQLLEALRVLQEAREEPETEVPENQYLA